MFMTKAKLKVGERGGTGALATFLAGSADHIGQGHHLVWSLFGDRQGKRPFVYRQTGGTADPILIYSAIKPEDANNLWELDTREFRLPDLLQVGDRIAWSLRINAIVKSENTKHCIVARARRNGDHDHVETVAAKVVPPWASEKLKRSGLEVAPDQIQVEGFSRRQFIHDPRRFSSRVTVACTDLRGIGLITDTDALKQAISDGVGASKAYGCGMLLIRRA